MKTLNSKQKNLKIKNLLQEVGIDKNPKKI